MKILVDKEKCFMSGECYYNHPELFKMDDEGYPEVLQNPLTKDLLKHAHIKKDIVVSAAVNILEIWDKNLYEEVIDEAKVDFSSLAEEVMGNENE